MEAARLRWSQQPVVVLALAVLVACLPIVTSAAVAVRAGWAPQIDEAAIQLHVLDVGTARTPLVGMPTKLVRATETEEPGNQPGPLQSWLLAPVFRAVSAGPAGVASMAIAQTILNVALIAASLVVLWQARRSTRDVLLGALFVAAGLWIAGGDVAFTPWNPNAAFVALLAACLAAAACHLGQRPVALATLAFTASVAAQPHLLFAVAAVVVGIGGAAPVVADAIRRRRLGPLVPALVVLAVVWSGPVIDVAVNEGGNPAMLLLGRSADDRATLGVDGALAKTATNLLPWRAAFWQQPTPERLSAPLSATDVLAMALVVLTLAVASLRGRTAWFGRVTITALTFLAVMSAVSPASPGVLFGLHQQRVWVPFTIATWGTIVVWFASLVARGFGVPAVWPRLRDGLLGAIVVVALVVACLPLVRGAAMVIAGPDCNDGIHTLAAALPDLDGRKVVIDSTGVPVWTLNFHSQVVLGLYAELVRQGADSQLAVGGGWQFIPGELGDRLIRPGEPWPEQPQVITLVGRDQPAPATGALRATATGENCTVAGDRLEVRLYG